MILSLEQVAWGAPQFRLEIDARLTGPIVGLFGPSGAGKTTILNLIAGIEKPLGGTIRFNDTVLTDGRGESVPPRLRRIGYVPQDRALFPHLTVRDNVMYGAGAPTTEPFTLEHVTELLDIASLLDRKPGRLSGGEQQRVAIARALLSRPALLLLDEPLSGLDENLKEKTLGLLNRLEAEFQIPMIYVSHSAGEVAAICDEVVVLEQGKLVAQGGPSHVFEETLAPLLRVRPKFPVRGIQA